MLRMTAAKLRRTGIGKSRHKKHSWLWPGRKDKICSGFAIPIKKLEFKYYKVV